MKLALTPARLRVLTSAAEGHIGRSKWGVGQDVHSGRQGCPCNLRPGQTVNRQVEWLIDNDLLRQSENSDPPHLPGPAFAWFWRPTDAGWAALGRSPF